VLFPTLSALNSPPTATREVSPALPTHPTLSLLSSSAPRHFDALEVSPTAMAPPSALPLLGPSRSTVRVSSTSNRRRTAAGAAILRCCLRCGPSGRRSRRPLYNSPSPRCRRRCRCCRSSLSSLFRVVADAVAVALVAEVAAVVLSLLLSSIRELRPQPHLRTARSNRGPRLRLNPRPLLSPSSLSVLSPSRSSLLSVSQKPPMPSPPRMLSLPVPASPSPSLLRAVAGVR